jgi:hypothetical protein
MIEKIILFGVVLFPFHNLSLPLAQSRYDFTAFILLSITIYYTIKNGRVSQRTILYMLAFVLMQILVFVFINLAPYHRLISGIVWLGGLFLIILSAKRFRYRQDAVFKTIIYVLVLSAFYIFFQFFFLSQSRPPAWFDEPSNAGLALYSAAAGILSTIVIVKMPPHTRLVLGIIFLVLLSAALLTLSMHFVTFLLVVALVFFLWSSKYILSFSLKRALIFLTIGSILAFVSSYLIGFDHYSSRLSIINPGTNLSLLAWLQGFDQMIGSISNSPIFGNGLGSTGYVVFNSAHYQNLESLGVGNLTLSDAFSLAFRLVIEIGLPVFLIFMLYFARRLNVFRNYMANVNKVPATQSIPVVFNFIFAASLIIGALIKEPLYPNSSLYLGVFLFASAPLAFLAYGQGVSLSFKSNPFVQSDVVGQRN